MAINHILKRLNLLKKENCQIYKIVLIAQLIINIAHYY